MSIRFSRLALVAVVTTMMGVGTRAAQAETREQRPGPPPGPQFDKAGALEVLKAIPLQSCKTATSPKGRSALTVTFESSGAERHVHEGIAVRRHAFRDVHRAQASGREGRAIRGSCGRRRDVVRASLTTARSSSSSTSAVRSFTSAQSTATLCLARPQSVAMRAVAVVVPRDAFTKCPQVTSASCPSAVVASFDEGASSPGER